MASINKENVRKVTNALRDGPKRLGELQHLGLNIEKRTLINILHYLEYWKFANKDKYTEEWYLLTNHIIELRDVAEYQAMLEHSRFLLPAIYKTLAKIGVSSLSLYKLHKDVPSLDDDPLLNLSIRCLCEHLKYGYSEGDVLMQVEILYRHRADMGSKMQKLEDSILYKLEREVSPYVCGDMLIYNSQMLVTYLTSQVDVKVEFEYNSREHSLYLQLNDDISILPLAINISKNEAEKVQKAVKDMLEDINIKSIAESYIKEIGYINELKQLKDKIGNKLLEIYASIKAGKIIDGRCHLCPNIKD